jgi:hypothetical protein
LVPEQFGIGKGITIQQAILTLTNSILSVLNKQQQAGEIFCDLSRAFDYIRFKILIFKFNHYAIHGTSLTWFQSYLAEKRKRVDTASSNNNVITSSSRKEIEHGVHLDKYWGHCY